MGNCKSYPYKINAGEEDEMTIVGYCRSFPKFLLACFLVVFSCGILLFLASWKRSIMLKLTHTQCPLENAEKVLLVDSYNQEFVETVVRPREDVLLRQQQIYFCNKKIKYIWQVGILQYVKVGGLEVDSCSTFHSLSEGLHTTEAVFRLQLYGKNSIFVEVKPVIKLILLEIGSPFYIYQMFIVVVWLIQLYYQFTLCIVLLSIISVTATVWETRKQSKALRDAVQSHSIVTVLRDGKETQKSSHELVPGDVIILPQSNFILECDAVLISGSCVVNESMLTGESTPITKVPITNDDSVEYSPTAHKRSTLFCGTQVLYSLSQDGSPVKAVVYRTGFSTAKGELVRAILYPKPVDLKLYRELFKSMIIFFIIGIPVMVYTGIIWFRLDAYVKEIVIIVVDVATFLVPPVLPAVLTSINAHAQRRLRKHGIYCLNTRHINISGSLDVVCFDKTGTLTEDSLDLSGIVPANRCFQPLVNDLSQMPDSPLVTAMATCHSLTKVEGRLIGYTLDVKMFEASGWELEEPGFGNLAYFEKVPLRILYQKRKNSSLIKELVSSMAIVREFPFESFLQRMSVVTKAAGGNHFEVYLKGAPEIVSSLSEKDSIPDNFKEVLESYTKQGFRVLAVGWKTLPVEFTWNEVLQIKREELECELKFQGLLILQNRLKPETCHALKILKQANIRSVMVTGDNLLTAITVARDCGMVDKGDSVISVEAEVVSSAVSPTESIRVHYSYSSPPRLGDKLSTGQNGIVEDMYLPVVSEGRHHLAMDGKTFSLIRNYDPQLLLKVIHRGTVFARMLPEQKLYLIEGFQQLGHQVGMCGDGANDCGALKTAHAGISLSVAEASVASPFTSKKQNVHCIPTLIREGRATLVATFGAFQYMVCYCFVLLGAVLILFWDGQKVSDGAYVLIDIILNLLPPILFGGAAAYHGLVKRPPTLSILSFLPQFSMYTFIFSQIGVLLLVRYYCMMQPWYEPFVFDKTRTHYPTPSHLTAAILSVNMMSYVIAAIIFSPGPPYRSSTFYSNKIYTGVVLVEFILVTFLTIYPSEFISYYLNFKLAPYLDFHLTLYCISLGNFIFCYIWECFIIQGLLFEYLIPAFNRWRGPVHAFEKLEQELQKSNWPPVGQYEGSRADSQRKGETLNYDGSTESSKLHSRKNEWSWKSDEIHSSLLVGLRLSRPHEWKGSRSEPASLVTFHDGTHQVTEETLNKETQAQDFV